MIESYTCTTTRHTDLLWCMKLKSLAMSHPRDSSCRKIGRLLSIRVSGVRCVTAPRRSMYSWWSSWHLPSPRSTSPCQSCVTDSSKLLITSQPSALIHHLAFGSNLCASSRLSTCKNKVTTLEVIQISSNNCTLFGIIPMWIPACYTIGWALIM